VRAHQRYLAQLPVRRQLSDEEYAPLEHVRFESSARQRLLRHLYAPGRLRGGPLFGVKEGDTLRVQLVASSGYPWWSAEPSAIPLEPDERYTLGWSDCLEAMYDGEIDWIGNWLARADSSFGDVCEEQAWAALGVRQGLFDTRHALVVVGWSEAALTGRAYMNDFEGLVQLDCIFETTV